MKTLTYKDAGVDIASGNDLVKRIKEMVASTSGPQVLGGIGGFGGLYALDSGSLQQPTLVAGADGVGTKLKLAFDLNKHDTVGIDLVAMSVNDIVTLGARPLFFLDYFACGRLEVDQAATVISGIAHGCREAGCALLGGETAEMPSFYPDGEYDLAGFSVGLVGREQIIDGSTIRAGDRVIGLLSSGVHSNGFSLVRRVLAHRGMKPTDTVDGLSVPIGIELLTPTRIYVKPVLSLLDEGYNIKGIAHITGGGLIENIPRILPADLSVRLDPASWPCPSIFSIIQGTEIEDGEMYRTFNMGIGLVLVVSPDSADNVIAHLSRQQEQGFLIGDVVIGPGGVELEGLHV